LCLCGCSVLLVAAVAAPPAKKTIGKVNFGNWKYWEGYRDRMEFTGGRPFVAAEDGSFIITADKLIVVFAKPTKGLPKEDQATIKSATAEGNVVMMAKSDATTQRFDATAAKAEYLSDRDIVVLTGKVHVVVTDPEWISVANGEIATYNLHPTEDQLRFKVEGAPGQSELTITPKPKE